MADNRRTPPRGSRPRGRTGPGRVPGRGAATRGGASTPGRGVAPPPQRRPRFTARAAVLVLVVAVLAVSYASSMGAYLDQRAEINALKERNEKTSASIDELERETRRWKDPAYVQAQARERLKFVMRGERSYVVLDEDGEALESESELSDPADLDREPPEAWWGRAWESVELAGHPPKPAPPPAAQIDGSDEPDGDQ
ncbi:septum formation initiator family protein [Nocardioides sp. cx-173]|uniref:FtsB family cell division protein n=1 Tax=Nocardioides sp. cx-173 TaxID=2898796 RepID=UPI001E494AD7|nr:septum formation initiator family protein [Nocardioides sp. cx-173]MCD4526660.1 septum formation initiator family protein [Nocardioides sp. cx-173]UGB42597.1 septum formation initiator family protein [Nocardioides sp. cx-173]